MVASACFFGVMAVVIRIASAALHPFEIAFFRSFFGALVALPLLLRHGPRMLRTDRIGFYAVRCAIGENVNSSSTNASVAASSLSSGTHSVAMPQSTACLPAMRLERITMSLVRVMPTIFCRRAEPPEPGI